MVTPSLNSRRANVVNSTVFVISYRKHILNARLSLLSLRGLDEEMSEVEDHAFVLTAVCFLAGCTVGARAVYALRLLCAAYGCR